MKNILSRPLFMAKGGESFPDLSGDGKITKKDILMGRGVIPREMQMGGVASMMPPPPMPMAPAPMVDPAAQVQLTEATAAREGEALGKQYVDEMMVGIDTADSTEELIDAIRGNDKTLQQRYDELAGFVGEADASATPESVLTLVQPTIMMTEQGAMDSGIGELMQSIAGEVDMETEMGAPTPMGMGVGELMMTGSAEEIPQMNGGGVVQKFANGLEVKPIGPNLANLDELFMSLGQPATQDQFAQSVETRLPVYQRLLGDTDRTRRDLQSKFFFDVAQAGLNLASGVDPRTGQSMAGRPLGSQIAAAAQPVAASAGEQAAILRNVEDRAALGALQSAEAAEAARIGSEMRIRESLFDRAGQIRGQQTGFEGSIQLQELDNIAQLSRQNDQQSFLNQMAFIKEGIDSRLMSQNAKDIMQRLETEYGFRQDMLDDEQAFTEFFNSITDRQDKENARMLYAQQQTLQNIIGEQNRTRLQMQIDATAMENGLDRTHALVMQDEEFAQRSFELAERLENDFKIAGLNLEEAREQRIASIGGYGTGYFQQKYNPLRFIPFIGNLGEDSAFRADRDKMESLDRFKAEASQLAQAEFDFTRRLSLNAQFLNAQKQAAQQALANRQLDQDSFEFIVDAITDQQADISEIFGNSYTGTLNAIVADQSTLDDYAAGRLDPSLTNVVDQAILTLKQPVTIYNPQTGFTEQRTPELPRAVQQALLDRVDNGFALPNEPPALRLNLTNTAATAPIEELQRIVQNFDTRDLMTGPRLSRLRSDAPPLSLNPFQGLFAFSERYQDGGEVSAAERRRKALEKVQSFLGQPSSGEGAAGQNEQFGDLPGLIVDESVDFEQATGPVSGFKRAVNTAIDYGQDVLGTAGTGPLFPDVVDADEQLKSISNMTQRFIRESTTGRPFAVEIEALANELAQPGTFKTDTGTVARLRTMRTQLSEIDNTINAILSNPQGFDQRKVIGAREDKLQLGPLLDNYDKLIKAYERGMGITDKPDPAMFERGRR